MPDRNPSVIPAKAGIQEGGVGVLNELRFLPACWNNASVVIPASGGNVLCKPLDSSAFVPDAALPPASMQAGLRRNNDGGGNEDGSESTP